VQEPGSLLLSGGREGWWGHLPPGLALGGSWGSAQPLALGDWWLEVLWTHQTLGSPETHECACPQPIRLLLLLRPALLPRNQGPKRFPSPGGPEASPLPTAPKAPLLPTCSGDLEAIRSPGIARLGPAQHPWCWAWGPAGRADSAGPSASAVTAATASNSASGGLCLLVASLRVPPI